MDYPIQITKCRLKVLCGFCRKEIEIWKNDLKPENFCSRLCANSRTSFKEQARLRGLANRGRKYPNRSTAGLRRGPEHHNWKGGITFISKKGYYKGFKIKYVRCPDEFKSMARGDGYVMEHRLLMAEKIGRPLLRRECVHHIDHNPENNAIRNLMLFPTNANHKKYEAQNQGHRN
jgi:hypothetical protein